MATTADDMPRLIACDRPVDAPTLTLRPGILHTARCEVRGLGGNWQVQGPQVKGAPGRVVVRAPLNLVPMPAPSSRRQLVHGRAWRQGYACASLDGHCSPL